MAKKQRKKRKKKGKASGGSGGSGGGGGIMTGMVSGFRRVTGVEKPKRRTLFDHILTVILLIAVAVVFYWRFLK